MSRKHAVTLGLYTCICINVSLRGRSGYMSNRDPKCCTVGHETSSTSSALMYITHHSSCCDGVEIHSDLTPTTIPIKSLLHEVRTKPPKTPSLKRRCSIIVGLSVSKTASTVTFLRYHGARTFSRVEPTASRSAVGI